MHIEIILLKCIYLFIHLFCGMLELVRVYSNWSRARGPERIPIRGISVLYVLLVRGTEISQLV